MTNYHIFGGYPSVLAFKNIGLLLILRLLFCHKIDDFVSLKLKFLSVC